MDEGKKNKINNTRDFPFYCFKYVDGIYPTWPTFLSFFFFFFTSFKTYEKPK